MSRKKLYTTAVIYFLIVIGFITMPPTVNLINRIEPYILGFPCFQFFILLTAVLIGVGLMAWFKLEEKIDNKENMGGEQ